MTKDNHEAQGITILRRFPFLADLTDKELEALRPILHVVKFKRGDYLFHEGDPGDSLYFLYEGTVVAEKILDSEAGTRKNIALIPSGTFFGEMAIIDNSPRSASVKVEINAEAYEIRKDDFRRFLEACPDVAFKMLRSFYREISQRLRNTNDELVVVYDVGKTIASVRDFRELARAILQRLVARLASSYGLFALYFEELKAFEVMEALGTRAETLKGIKIAADEGLIGNSVSKRIPLLIEKLIGSTEPWESDSMIIAPLLMRDRIVGLFVLGVSKSGASYTTSDLYLTTAIANLSAPAIDSALQKMSNET